MWMNCKPSTTKLTIFFHPRVVTTSKLTIFFHPLVVTTSGHHLMQLVAFQWVQIFSGRRSNKFSPSHAQSAMCPFIRLQCFNLQKDLNNMGSRVDQEEESRLFVKQMERLVFVLTNLEVIKVLVLECLWINSILIILTSPKL